MNKYYQRGIRAERELKEMLEKQGYEVFRCAGSHGRADLIAVYVDKPEHIEEPWTWACRLIQVKTCQEKDFEKYKREKVPGIELWIKLIGHGWRQL